MGASQGARVAVSVGVLVVSAMVVTGMGLGAPWSPGSWALWVFWLACHVANGQVRAATIDARLRGSGLGEGLRAVGVVGLGVEASLGVLALRQILPLAVIAVMAAAGLLWYAHRRFTLHRIMGGWITLSEAGRLQPLLATLQQGLTDAAAGEPRAARDRFADALRDNPLLGSYPDALTGVRLALGRTFALAGENAAAVEEYRHVLAFYRSVGNRAGMREALVYLGELSAATGDLRAAREYLEESIAHTDGQMHRVNFVKAHRLLAGIGYEEDDRAAMIRHANTAVESGRRWGCGRKRRLPT